MGVGPYTNGSQPAEPPEQPSKWKYGAGCALVIVLLVVFTSGLVCAMWRLRKRTG